MSDVSIQLVMLDDLLAYPEFSRLLDEYGAECALAGMPPFKADIAKYRELERNGVMHIVIAEKAGALIGLATVLITVIPHYSAKAGITESLFVSPHHRAGSAGLRMIRFIERLVAHCGGVGVFITAPAGGKLEKVLRKSKAYRNTNAAFFKSLL